MCIRKFINIMWYVDIKFPILIFSYKFNYKSHVTLHDRWHIIIFKLSLKIKNITVFEII